MKKILWFSRHAMSVAQLEALKASLGEVEVTQINGTAANVHVPFESTTPESGETEADVILVGTQPALKELVKNFDEVAAVLPIGMIQQILPFLNGRMLQARNKRILLEDGKVQFSFDGWQAVKEIKIVVEDL
jgi:hypothetical protein